MVAFLVSRCSVVGWSTLIIYTRKFYCVRIACSTYPPLAAEARKLLSELYALSMKLRRLARPTIIPLLVLSFWQLFRQAYSFFAYNVMTLKRNWVPVDRGSRKN